MRAFRIAMGIWLAAARADAVEIRGRVSAREDGRPLAGALVRLLVRGDSAFTDSAGAFRFDPARASLRPPAGPRELRVRVRSGRLEYDAPDREAAALDLFATDGRLLGSLRHRPSAPGTQRVDLAALAAGRGGLAWLRLQAGNRTHWIRILSLGAGAEPVGLSRDRGAIADPPRAAALGQLVSGPKGGALGKTAWEIIDTLVVEKAGYYPARGWAADTAAGSDAYRFSLWKNPSYGLDPAVLEAWKAHLTRPAVTLRIDRFGVFLPAGLDAGKVELDDGTEADGWTTSRCLPDPRPKSVRLAYTRQGHVYRDTVRLEPIWKLLDSYRAAGVDTLGPYAARFHLAWDWPKGYSAVPERDWTELMLIKGMAEDHSVSHPDAFLRGVQYGWEGGVHRYDAYDPALGAWTMDGMAGARLGIKAEFTLARRDEHDLRVLLADYGEKAIEATRVSFANAWPDDGIVRTGQVLRLQAASEPPSPSAILALVPEGAGSPLTLKYPWDGAALDWTFDLPFRDSLSFRLRASSQSDPLGTIIICQVPAESPLLRAVREPGDTAAIALEPNESEAEAAPVSLGRWIEAAADYRPSGDRDRDFYRIGLTAGSRIRFTLRNVDAEDVVLVQDFSPGQGGISPGRGTQMTDDFSIATTREYVFQVYVPGAFGRYAFRLDPIP